MYRQAYLNYVRTWKQTNAERVRMHKRDRRARQAGAPIRDLTRREWEAIKVAFDHRCAYWG